MEYKPNAYERDIIDYFTRIAEEAGVKENFVIEGNSDLERVYCINKINAYWQVKYKEEGKKPEYNYYHDLYNLAISMFDEMGTLERNHFICNFPSKEFFEKREEERASKKYRLYGTLKLTGVTRGSVEPIFEDEEHNLFTGDTKTDLQILTKYTTFVPLDKSLIELVRPLSETDNVLAGIQDYYKVYHRAIYATEFAPNRVYIGDLPNYMDFLETFETDDVKYAAELEKQLEHFDWVINKQWDQNDYYEREDEFVFSLRKQKGTVK